MDCRYEPDDNKNPVVLLKTYTYDTISEPELLVRYILEDHAELDD